MSGLSRLTGVFGVVVAFAMAACGGGSGESSGQSSPTGPAATPGSGFPAGTLRLSVSPIAQSAILWITPLGNMNPPQHTLPTDHIYFYFADPDANQSPVTRRTTFFAPGDGTVTTLFGGVGLESKIYVRQTSTFSYYLDHLILTVPLVQGSKVTAGQVLGTSGSAYAVDLGVWNESLHRSFVNPARYLTETLQADAPLKYFDEPQRGQLYAKVQRLGTDLDGTIDYDVAGTLAGNWFAADSTQLVFAYDTYDPNKVLISVSSNGSLGVFSIGATDPLPKNVTTASGIVRYTVSNASSGFHPSHTTGVVGFILAQVIDATHVKEQTFLTLTAPTDFTGAARTFFR